MPSYVLITDMIPLFVYHIRKIHIRWGTGIPDDHGTTKQADRLQGTIQAYHESIYDRRACRDGFNLAAVRLKPPALVNYSDKCLFRDSSGHKLPPNQVVTLGRNKLVYDAQFTEGLPA
jgi:hypothetical protein